jgi:IMP dehydrogenase
MKTALTYDDITLIPAYSEIESRQNIDLTTQLTNNYSLRIPLIASPMDTVCDSKMAIAMARLGGVGCIHRFMSIEEQAEEVQNVKFAVYDNIFVTPFDSDFEIPIMAAIGANGDYLERAKELTNSGANVILIDVAHGHHKFVKEALFNLKKILPSYVDIIAGNVATSHAAIDLEFWGADAIRVGIGGGSLCTTRLKTGFGIPNITSLEDCSTAVNVPVIACGGIRDSGDIAKALAVGASSVILGSLLAGTDETPGPIIDGNVKRYRGAASRETKLVHNQSQRNVEGASTYVYYKGPVAAVIEGLMDGLRSALSYAGANNLTEFTPSYMNVTSAGVHEAKPHLIK